MSTPPPLSPTLAVGRLTRTIRGQLPLANTTVPPLPRTRQIAREDLVSPDGELLWHGGGTFRDLLTPMPAEWPVRPRGGESWPPERDLRLSPQLQAIETALRSVWETLEPVPTQGLGHLQGLLDELADAPLYWWQWTGTEYAERTAEGKLTPAFWVPVQVGFSPVDGSLLDALEREGERLLPVLQHTPPLAPLADLPPLSPSQADILTVLFRAKVVSPDKRMTAEKIAEKSGYKPDTIKREGGELVAAELLKSRRYGNGGYWLSEQGRIRASIIAQ